MVERATPVIFLARGIHRILSSGRAFNPLSGLLFGISIPFSYIVAIQKYRKTLLYTFKTRVSKNSFVYFQDEKYSPSVAKPDPCHAKKSPRSRYEDFLEREAFRARAYKTLSRLIRSVSLLETSFPDLCLSILSSTSSTVGCIVRAL